jgi:hypothetical protein
LFVKSTSNLDRRKKNTTLVLENYSILGALLNAFYRQVNISNHHNQHAPPNSLFSSALDSNLKVLMV